MAGRTRVWATYGRTPPWRRYLASVAVSSRSRTGKAAGLPVPLDPDGHLHRPPVLAEAREPLHGSWTRWRCGWPPSGATPLIGHGSRRRLRRCSRWAGSSLAALDAHRAFHAALYRASHNDLLVSLLDGLWD